MATQRIPFQWGNANFAWETNPFPNQSANPFTWDDVALIITVLEGLGGGGKPEDLFKDKEYKLLIVPNDAFEDSQKYDSNTDSSKN